MDIFKKNQYVILLLLVILFVSLSFSIILNININTSIKEGLTCLPNCEDVSMNNTTGTTPECKKYISKSLMSNDAKLIVNQCVTPFIKSINDLMNTKYSYNTIYKTIYNKNTTFIPSQKDLNAYFTDSSSVTIQDIMDKLCDNIDNIRNNAALKSKNISQIIYQIQTYKTDRETPSSDIKQKYDDFAMCVDKYMISVTTRCENYYNDETFNTTIKDAKETPTYYGLSSSFHKLRSYLVDSMNNKLESFSNQ